jgi:hypothetical protein
LKYFIYPLKKSWRRKEKLALAGAEKKSWRSLAQKRKAGARWRPLAIIFFEK